VNIGLDIDARHTAVAEIIGPAREIDVIVFEFCGPVAAHGKFDAGARGPAELVLRAQQDGVSGAVIKIDVAVSPGRAAGHIRQQRSEEVSDPAAHGANAIERRVERRGRQCRGVQRTSERCVSFDAEHDMVRKLTIVAGLITADEARNAVWKEYALLGERIGARAEAAAGNNRHGRPDKTPSNRRCPRARAP